MDPCSPAPSAWLGIAAGAERKDNNPCCPALSGPSGSPIANDSGNWTYFATSGCVVRSTRRFEDGGWAGRSPDMNGKGPFHGVSSFHTWALRFNAKQLHS